MEGGSALADILWGDYNPSGRLPISIPRSVGQIPVCYSQPVTGDYVEESAKPLYSFGYGLSYTQFEYSDMENNGSDISVTIRNVGAMDGDEVVQLYASEKVSALALSSERLIAFKRVHLRRGESQKVTFNIDSNHSTMTFRVSTPEAL
jgi:beta-glucosidase